MEAYLCDDTHFVYKNTNTHTFIHQKQRTIKVINVQQIQLQVKRTIVGAVLKTKFDVKENAKILVEIQFTEFILKCQKMKKKTTTK